MRAIVAARVGPPEVLVPTELPDPEPGPDQVVVAVEYAAISFIDTQMRAGTSPRPIPEDQFPVVLGNGVGGSVVALGEGVDAGWLDQSVVTSTGGRGGYASRAVAAVADLHRVPRGLELRDAVALLADGRTAIGLAQAACFDVGDFVVVSAAGGGVGTLLVQLASHASACVVAVAGDARKLEWASTLGAQFAVNYRHDDWMAQVAQAAPEGLAVVFDGVGGTFSRPMFDLLRPGGRYLPHGMSSGQWGGVDPTLAAQHEVTVIGLDQIGDTPERIFQLVEDALALGASLVLRPTIGQTYPLEEAAEAHAAIEARTTLGKTLLTL